MDSTSDRRRGQDRFSGDCVCCVPRHKQEVSNAKITAALRSCTSRAGDDRDGSLQRLERLHTELHIQSGRQDEAFERIVKVEADLGRIAKLTAENEGLHAAERQQRHLAMASLVKRSEEALAFCASLRSRQEDREALVRKLESLEVLRETQDKLTQRVDSLEKSQVALVESVETLGEEASVQQLRKEVDALHAEVRQRPNSSSLTFWRSDAVEQILDENARMRQELAQVRKESERRDLEMAEVQGQISALTNLFREQMSGMLGTRVRYSGA